MEADRRDAPVLIGEDNFLTGRLLAAVLQAEGKTVIVARNGAELLRLAIKHQPSLVILNMNISRPGGAEVIRLLHASDKELPIMALTAPGQSELKTTARELGIGGVFETPFLPAELASQARIMITGR